MRSCSRVAVPLDGVKDETAGTRGGHRGLCRGAVHIRLVESLQQVGQRSDMVRLCVSKTILAACGGLTPCEVSLKARAPYGKFL